MEALIHLDTHVVAWLWAGDLARLKGVRRILERSALVISPIVTLEIQYLFEIGRLEEPAHEIVGDLVDRLGLVQSSAQLSQVAARALGLGWTRDPFDRLIVGNALSDGQELLTKDATIRANFSGAVWRD